MESKNVSGNWEDEKNNSKDNKEKDKNKNK